MQYTCRAILSKYCITETVSMKILTDLILCAASDCHLI